MNRRVLRIGAAEPRSPESGVVLAGLALLGIEAELETVEPTNVTLAGAVRSVRTAATIGALVGPAWQERAAAAADRLAEDGRAVGAVDILTGEGTRAVGHQRTGAAFRHALDVLVGRQKMPKAALVLGSSGAARAIVHACITSGFQSVVVFDRHLHKAEALVRHFAKSAAHMDLRARPWHETVLGSELARTRVLVNATAPDPDPDASPLPAALLTDGLFVLDLDAGSPEPRLVRDARGAGAAAAAGGGELLLHRVGAALELWSGRRPDPVALAERLGELRAGAGAGA
ncbi:MAG: hypothetical protein ACKOTZ_00820 [Chloroflexota bacterium]